MGWQDYRSGDAFAITVADGAQRSPAAAYDPAANAYLVVWAHDNGSDADVRGRVVPAAGDPVAAEITITAAAADEQYPAVAANGAGGYVVAWQTYPPGHEVWLFGVTKELGSGARGSFRGQLYALAP